MQKRLVVEIMDMGDLMPGHLLCKLVDPDSRESPVVIGWGGCGKTPAAAFQSVLDKFLADRRSLEYIGR